MKFKSHPVLYSIAAILATWRLTNIIHSEEIASPLRKSLGVMEIAEEDPYYWAYPDNFFGRLLYCFQCVSVWSGMLIAVLLFVFPPLIIPLALSAGAIMVKRALEYEGNVWVEETLEEDADDNQ